VGAIQQVPSSSTWRHAVAAVMLMMGLATVIFAVSKDKAMYVGGTLRDFPRGGMGARVHVDILGGANVSKIEGRIDTQSESELVFDTGGNGSLAIPFKAVAALAYGLEPHEIPEGGTFLITWDPLDQYTSKAHYFLSIRYVDQAGVEQGVVFELGRDVVRPILQTLEARTGRAIEFTHIDACVVYKTREECGYGTPAELRGLTKLFVDADATYRDLIVAEIERAGLGLEVLSGLESAEVVLRFRGEEFHRPGYLQTLYGGRGEAIVLRKGGPRVVVVVTSTRMRPWGDKPATKFGAAFADAYRRANGR